jgi:thioredoxin 1
MSTSLTSPAVLREAIASTEGVLIVDFTAAWCGPCKQIRPILDAMAAAHTDLTVLAVDVDEQPSLAAEHQVLSMPTLLFVRDGQPVRRVVGARPRSYLEAELAAARKS